MLRRRRLLAALPALAALPWTARADGDAVAALRAGGCVLALRHALAPGTYDPPDMRLDDCRTQRNLSDEGRAQARRIGESLRARALVPRQVRSSPWCRCRETAQLAFGSAEDWRALGSPRAGTETTNAASLAELRAELQRVSARRDGFEAWVTHMFVLQDLTGSGTASGEGLVLRAGPDGRVQLLGRIVAA